MNNYYFFVLLVAGSIGSIYFDVTFMSLNSSVFLCGVCVKTILFFSYVLTQIPYPFIAKRIRPIFVSLIIDLLIASIMWYIINILFAQLAADLKPFIDFILPNK